MSANKYKNYKNSTNFYLVEEWFSFFANFLKPGDNINPKEIILLSFEGNLYHNHRYFTSKNNRVKIVLTSILYPTILVKQALRAWVLGKSSILINTHDTHSIKKLGLKVWFS